MAPTAVLKGMKKRKRDEADDQDASTAPKEKGEEFRQKTLLLSSRGVTHRMRHIMNDLSALLPQTKKDAKLDTKHQLYMVNELADLSSCNNAIFFEARRHQDLYMWLSKTPNGPSIKFHVLNSHTMDELKMTGNCLKGSRPIVCFDKSFDAEPQWRLTKELLMHTFAVPKTARKAKPFVDHIANFSVADNKIWFRNYQIVEGAADEAEVDTLETAKNTKGKRGAQTALSLSEIGPRFVLVPIKIFEGSFGGAVLWENKHFQTPSELSIQKKQARAGKYISRKDAQSARKEKLEAIQSQKVDDPLSGLFA